MCKWASLHLWPRQVTIVGHKTKNDEAAVIEEAKKAEVAVSATSSEKKCKKQLIMHKML